MSSTTASKMFELLELLGSIRGLLCNEDLSDNRLRGLFSKENSNFSLTGRALSQARVEALCLLRLLQTTLCFPTTAEKDWIHDFCLRNASIILCTASSSSMLHHVQMDPLQILVIDEAAQQKECESAIPLRLDGLNHAILVGDECQLPSTVKGQTGKLLLNLLVLGSFHLIALMHCLWLVENLNTLSESGTIWAELVHDAETRGGCFNAIDDANLAKKILRVKHELDQLDDLLKPDSMLLSNSRWKVLFRDDFKKSFAKLKQVKSKMEVIHLLSRLAEGWRSKRKIQGFSDSFKLVNIYKVWELYLIWTVDIVKNDRYVQVLKVWDLLPLEQIERLVSRLAHIFSLYTEVYVEHCKFSSTEGGGRHLLTANDGNEIDIPFELTDEEKEIVRFPLKLKQLYVAITRTKQRLWICENSDEYSKPMFDYWKKLCLIQVRHLDSSLAQSMKAASSSDDWKQCGIKLFNEKNFELAAMCFEKAGDDFNEKWARGAGLVANAERIIATNSYMAQIVLNQAAEIYESIHKPEIAATCYIKLKDFKKAGIIVLSIHLSISDIEWHIDLFIEHDKLLIFKNNKLLILQEKKSERESIGKSLEGIHSNDRSQEIVSTPSPILVEKDHKEPTEQYKHFLQKLEEFLCGKLEAFFDSKDFGGSLIMEMQNIHMELKLHAKMRSEGAEHYPTKAGIHAKWKGLRTSLQLLTDTLCSRIQETTEEASWSDKVNDDKDHQHAKLKETSLEPTMDPETNGEVSWGKKGSDDVDDDNDLNIVEDEDLHDASSSVQNNVGKGTENKAKKKKKSRKKGKNKSQKK
ncbi:hypothetical protein Cni_G14097 [Canna indica]|uniref:DNA2/NAM7 helicase helicase domain-containing protein n=1 Tax=Canna indica TaxID=4628 RepID=A0AAQ3QC27_9LILI|nr:hypothetical protein Cni_G14097 [Canna indica]